MTTGCRPNSAPSFRSEVSCTLIPACRPSIAVCSEAVLDRHARERPGKVFAVFENGESWTYSDLHARVRRAAASLQALGVRQGEYVLSWQPNGPHAILTWFALNYLGAVYVPVNTAYRGALLAHVVENSGASLMVLHGGLADRLAVLPPGQLRRAIVDGAPNAPLALETDRLRRAGKRQRRSDRTGRTDRAVAYPKRDLHVGHHRCVEGRDVIVSASVVDLDGVPIRDRGRPRYGQPALVPCRRDRRGLPDAGEGRIGRGRRIRSAHRHSGAASDRRGPPS